jgi:hypothetical protein
MITIIFVDMVPISNSVTDALCPGVACGSGLIDWGSSRIGPAALGRL